jgi:hypothetical protein
MRRFVLTGLGPSERWSSRLRSSALLERAVARPFPVLAGSSRPAARRARSVRFSTPNLLRRDEMWNFTVRTVMLSFEAISLFARLHRTECSTSRWRGLKAAGEATARPSSRSSLALVTISPMTFFSAGTMTTKSSGLNPRTRHCMANRLATRSRLYSSSFEEPARKWATPVLFSQKTKRLDRSARSLVCSLPSRTSLEKMRTLFNVGLVSASLENPRGSFLVLTTWKRLRARGGCWDVRAQNEEAAVYWGVDPSRFRVAGKVPNFDSSRTSSNLG